MNADITNKAGFRCAQCGYTWIGRRIEDRPGYHQTVKCGRCETRNGEQQVEAWDDDADELSDAYWDWLKNEHAANETTP